MQIYILPPVWQSSHCPFHYHVFQALYLEVFLADKFW